MLNSSEATAYERTSDVVLEVWKGAAGFKLAVRFVNARTGKYLYPLEIKSSFRAYID